MYKQGFQILYLNTEKAPCMVNIYNTLSGAGTPVFTPLTGADDVQHIFIVDNDENKFSPIKAKQAEFKFMSTPYVNLSTFIGSSDNQWYVESFVNDVLKFRGFLILDDLNEDFLEKDNVVALVATDNIGLLKDEPLTKTDGTNPRGFYSLIQYVSWCLQKTGIQANINVLHNVREENNPSQPMYQSCFLWSKTFEADYNESISCYEALELILGNDAYLTQENGEWWIVRVDDLQDGDVPVFVFNSDGGFLNQTTYDALHWFGLDEDLKFAEMGTFVMAQAAAKSLSLTYNYEFPKEIVDNIDFSRGPLFSVIDPRSPLVHYATLSAFPVKGELLNFYQADDTGLTYVFREGKYLNVTVTASRIDDWQTVGGPQAYIRRIYNNGYEIERYTVIPPATGSQDHFIQSQPVPIHQNDKFSFSVDWRLTTDLTSGGNATVFMAQIRLYGEDGSFWVLTNQNSGTEVSGQWIQSNASFSVVRYIANTYNINQHRETDYLTAIVDSLPLPISGNVVVFLREYTTNGRRETHFANLRFTYMPYINGSYQKFNGHKYTISQAVNTKKKIDETVRMADSPKRLFKGALHVRNGIDFKLAGRFYDGRQFGATVPAAEYLHPFTHNQAYCLWNQNNRPFRLFDFKAQGLQSADIVPGITHRYRIVEPSEHTVGKWFMMLHHSQDFHLCSWEGVMAEMYDDNIPKKYSDPIELKYISGNE